MTDRVIVSKPRKFSAALIGGSLAVIVLWIVAEFGAIKVPPDVAAAVGALLTYGTSFFIPDEIEE